MADLTADPRVTERFKAERDADRLQLLCVGHAGAGASVFASWAAETQQTGDLDLVALRLPGRESRFAVETSHTLDEVVGDLLIAAGNEVHGARYVVLGQCSGAFVALELGRRLYEQTGRPPEVAVLISQEPLLEPASAGDGFDTARYLGSLVERGELPPELAADADYLELFTPLIEADLAMAHAYAAAAPHPAVGFPILALCGTDETPEVLARQPGWAALTSAVATSRVLPGGHFLTSSAADPVLAAIRETVRGS